ncbi:MAG: hypothetical protein LBR28_04570 [Bacteroidales bacterium]|jgi:nitrite reductase/ring-hydroxylating ferredoxin subunit|nr:hypothetical protein [Bacteroidales bacterium]
MGKRLAVYFILLFAAVGCQEDFTDYGYVNFYIEPDSLMYSNLNIGNRGWEYMQGGYRGVVIFRKSAMTFAAYERSCTGKDCHGLLEVDTTNNVLIHCTKCGSDFLYVDGSPLEGSPAKRMLYSYCTFFDGEKLWVNNCE